MSRGTAIPGNPIGARGVSPSLSGRKRWGSRLRLQISSLMLMAKGSKLTSDDPACSDCFSLWASLTSWPSFGFWSWPALLSLSMSTSAPGPPATPSPTPPRPQQVLATCVLMPECMVSSKSNFLPKNRRLLNKVKPSRGCTGLGGSLALESRWPLIRVCPGNPEVPPCQRHIGRLLRLGALPEERGESCLQETGMAISTSGEVLVCLTMAYRNSCNWQGSWNSLSQNQSTECFSELLNLDMVRPSGCPQPSPLVLKTDRGAC